MSHSNPSSVHSPGNSTESVNSPEPIPFPSKRFIQLTARFLSAPPHSRGDPLWPRPKPVCGERPRPNFPSGRSPVINPHRTPSTQPSPSLSHQVVPFQNEFPSELTNLQAMKGAVPPTEQVEILSDDSSSSDGDDYFPKNILLDVEPSTELPSEGNDEAWLFRRAKSYQEYMKLIPIPKDRQSVIPYTSWAGLARAIKHMYGQPLHYLTNIHIKQLDQARLGAENECDSLDLIIHPVKAEASIWLIEEIHRLTTSPHHLLRLWQADPMYHAFIDDIFPKLS